MNKITGQILNKNLKSSAFTIVELLVVIVVIGILAVITVVSYSGITARAYNAKAVSIVDSYQKIFEMYRAEHGVYPSDGGMGAIDRYCLGNIEDYPAIDGFSAGECVHDDVNDGYFLGENLYVNADYNTQLGNAFGGKVLSATLPTVYIPGVKYRGVFYYESSPPEGNPAIVYIMPGDRDCARGEKNYSEGVDATLCIVELSPINTIPSTQPEEDGSCEKTGTCS